jgi:hypothetical protein
MEMKNPHVIWAAVAIVVALVGGAVALVAMDKDVSVILTLAGLVAMPVLGAFGAALYQKLDQVKDASNGHLTASNATLNRMMEMQQKTQEQLTTLALSMNPQAPIVSPEKESDPGS